MSRVKLAGGYRQVKGVCVCSVYVFLTRCWNMNRQRVAEAGCFPRPSLPVPSSSLVSLLQTSFALPFISVPQVLLSVM